MSASFNIITFQDLTFCKVNLLPYANHIVALDDQGQIVEQGSFNDLNSKQGYVHSFALQEPVATETPTPGFNAVHVSSKEELEISIPLNTARQNGDLSVYTYYFRTMGMFSLVLFIVLEISFAFFSTFPCK
jgi:ATP-binding cassette, subfamily C (CFTR/MRP), member 1